MDKYVVIGKLVENIKDSKKVTAYKLYNIETKKSYLCAKEEVSKAMKNGIKVLGLKIQYMAKKKEVTPVCREDRTFGVQNVDTVNEQGEPIENNKHILFSIQGFGQSRIYKTVDSKGTEEHFNITQMIELASQNKIIGCSVRRGSLYVNKNIIQEALECK